jgi:hypothetical protein
MRIDVQLQDGRAYAMEHSAGQVAEHTLGRNPVDHGGVAQVP